MDSEYNNIGYQIIGAAYEVRKLLGRFLYEETYERALQIELELRGLAVRRQVSVPAFYKGIQLENALRVDLVVEDKILVEIKAISFMGSAEVSQIMTYLKMSGCHLGYLINFGAEDFTADKYPEDSMLYKGIYRFINS